MVDESLAGERIAAPSLRVRRVKLTDALYPAAGLVVIAVLWQLIPPAVHVPAQIFPPLSDVLVSLGKNIGDLWGATLVTVAESMLGLVIAIVIGVALGALFVTVPVIQKVVMPIIVGLQAMPKIAIAPLFIVWMGYSEYPKVLMAFLLSFFPIVINTVIGLSSVDEDHVSLIRSMEGTRASVYRFVRVPAAIPSIVGGVQVAVSLSLIGAIVGEFVGSSSGLGYLILVASGNVNTSLIFAAILVLTIVGIVLYAVVTIIGGFLTRWNRPG